MELFEKHRKALFIILIVAILITGMFGFYQRDKDFFEAMFNTLILFLTQYPQAENRWLFVARILAILFAGLTIVALLYNKFMRYLKIRKARKSILIFGDNEESRNLVEYLKEREISVVFAEDKKWCYPALKYVLLDSEEENIAYYNRHKQILKDSEIHSRGQSISGQILNNDKLHFFSMEELLARYYWLIGKELGDYLYNKWKIKDTASDTFNGVDYEVHISIIGYGEMGRELLFYAPQYNIFHPRQTIIYHVFTDEEDVHYLNPSWEDLGIKIEEGEWYQSIEILKKSEFIILPEQKNMISLLHKVRSFVPEIPIDILTLKDVEKQIFYHNRTFSNQTAIGVYSLYDSNFVDLILQEDSIVGAKQLNFNYAQKIGKQGTMEELWNELDSFTKYSNISSADYRKILTKIVEKLGVKEPLGKEEMDFFAELEHIRWMNYHYSNGWSLDENLSKNVGGARKNMKLKKHGDLIPYKELDEETKEKDRNNIREFLKTLHNKKGQVRDEA